MSARSLQRLFKSKTGMTTWNICNSTRLCQAALLLRQVPRCRLVNRWAMWL